MPIEILTQSLHKQLFASFRGSKGNIRIISPFLSNETAKQLVIIMKQYHLHCEVITRFSEEDFWRKASSIDAIDKLLRANIDVYGIKGIHTKLYMIDNDIAFVGSANFTNHGIQPHTESEQEMLIKIYDDSDALTKFDQYFCSQKNPKASISLEIVEQVRSKLASISVPEKPKVPLHDHGYKRPAKVSGRETSNKSESKQRIWLKFEASSNKRAERSDSIDAQNKRKTNFSEKRKPTGFSDGDILFIAKHSKDANGNPMPIIVYRANCYKFDPSQKDPEVPQWPYYLNLYNVRAIGGTVSSGIELRELIEAIGNNTYVNTVGDNRSYEDLMHSHRQQAAREMTEFAKDYLDARFELYNKD